jgi:hypothetical protein
MVIIVTERFTVWLTDYMTVTWKPDSLIHPLYWLKRWQSVTVQLSYRLSNLTEILTQSFSDWVDCLADWLNHSQNLLPKWMIYCLTGCLNFSTALGSDQIWNPPKLLQSEHCTAVFSGYISTNVKLINYLLRPRLIIHGALPPYPYTPSYRSS